MFRATTARKSALAVAVITGVLMVSTAASAHVEISADGPPGSDDVVLASLFAENECTANLANVELVFPTTPELTVATPVVADGWTSEVVKRPGSAAVASVKWTNSGTATGDGKFQLALGLISNANATVNFKALQTCADGKIFRWIEPNETDEFPAPVLALDHTGHTGHDHPDTTSETKVAVTTKAKSSDDSSTAIIIGIAAGAVVLIGAGLVMLKRSKK